MPETNLPPLHLHVNENIENKCNLIDVPSLRRQLPKLPEHIRQTLQDRGLTPHMYLSMTVSLHLKLIECVLCFNQLLLLE